MNDRMNIEWTRRSGPPNPNDDRCFRCDQPGHFARNCTYVSLSLSLSLLCHLDITHYTHHQPTIPIENVLYNSFSLLGTVVGMYSRYSTSLLQRNRNFCDTDFFALRGNSPPPRRPYSRSRSRSRGRYRSPSRSPIRRRRSPVRSRSRSPIRRSRSPVRRRDRSRSRSPIRSRSPVARRRSRTPSRSPVRARSPPPRRSRSPARRSRSPVRRSRSPVRRSRSRSVSRSPVRRSASRSPVSYVHTADSMAPFYATDLANSVDQCLIQAKAKPLC